MQALYKFGSYKFKQLLGQGMYAEVYLAEKEKEVYAVKVIHKGKHRKRGTVHAQKEIAALTHLGEFPGVVRLKEWEERESSFFIVLSYLHGYTLNSMPSPLSTQENLQTALSILETLKRMHSLGVYHLDLKPSNVIVASHGVYLVDFGCSIVSSAKTIERAMLPFEGTPAYMAPEMIKQAQTHINLESLDVWSFGCLLYHMTAQKDAFVSTSLYALYPKILHCKIDYACVPCDIQQICKSIFISYPGSRIDLDSLIALVKSKLLLYDRPVAP